MKKQNVIRINGSQLKQMISESVMKVLSEASYRDAAKKGDYTSTLNKHTLNYKKKHENDKNVIKHFHKFAKKHNLDKTKPFGSAVCNYEDGCNDDGKYVRENLYGLTSKNINETNVIKENHLSMEVEKEDNIRQIVSESIKRAMIEEGFWDNMKSAWQGAKQGYNAQQTLDRGTEGFKQQHDHEDAMAAMDPLTKMPNTAEEQSAEIYKQYQAYQTKANQLLSLYKKLNKQYGLEKVATGKYVNANKQPMGAGLDKRPQSTPRFMREKPSMPRVNGGMGASM